MVIERLNNVDKFPFLLLENLIKGAELVFISNESFAPASNLLKATYALSSRSLLFSSRATYEWDTYCTTGIHSSSLIRLAPKGRSMMAGRQSGTTCILPVRTHDGSPRLLISAFTKLIVQLLGSEQILSF